jgi:hypothetical protein
MHFFLEKKLVCSANDRHARRVTRLGQFSHIGQFFLKIIKVEQHFGLLFYTAQTKYYRILTKNGLGYILGDSFTNASGHPARVEQRSTQQTK